MSAASASFLDGLDAQARELLLAVSTPVSFMAGATLVRHGDPARGAYVLRQGTADAEVTLPGGEKLVVARLGPGGVFGEMALVELGTCTATVRATSSVDGWFVSNEDFRALVSQRSPAAVHLQHAVTSIIAAKLAALNAQLLDCTTPEDRPARVVAAGADPLAGVARSRHASFHAAAFLPRLPFFEHFTADEVDEFAAAGRYIEIARGQRIFTSGAAAGSAFLVVRGAAEIVHLRGECERRVAVLGPGQLIGYTAVLGERVHGANAFARESALLLDIPASAFRELYFGERSVSTRLRAAVQRSLLGSMARTNRALTRLLVSRGSAA
ncbi:MAG TPA: cyclic nucleotide-binding domain-containing protein [Usitatibacter sp.]|nr:cyclic nucleotide-binding domain-containing protein [Usitatibacter sp.]